VSRTHNPEFSLLEFYRPQADYAEIMVDLERALAHAEHTVREGAEPGPFSRLPYERLTVREALRRHTGIDLARCADAEALAKAASELGVHVSADDTFDDVFFRLFLERVEPRLGRDRPTYLIEYPASMASLARLKPSDPSVAERFELYVNGLELANGYSELTDPLEQRARLVEEQALRIRLGRSRYELDEPFLAALGRMPPSGGVAVGLDRVLMLLLEAERIEDVLLFPAHGFV
jgi:lysyl-tRNA synthetase class 2